MAVSQNGWQAGTKDDAAVEAVTLPGTGVSFPGGLRRGDVATVLLWLAAQFHARVEPLTLGWCWGYNFRPIRGASKLSNHSSGTAVDFNAPRHPLSKRGTFTPAQVATIRQLLAELDGVVRWGGDYDGRADEMHFEVVGAPIAVARVAARLRAGTPAPILNAAPAPAVVAIVGGAGGPDGLLRPGAKGVEVVGWQRELWRIGYGVGAHDGVYGPATEGATLDVQRASGPGTDDDGIVGPRTRDVARAVPTYPKPEGPGLPLAGPDGPAGTVHAFQVRLAARGWTITPDGKYGPKTADTVRRFQDDVTRRGFVIGRPDGIGGPATWTALWAAPVTP